MSKDFIDHYVVLGISFDATEQEIKKAHKNLVSKYHPDGQKDQSYWEEMMKRANVARDILLNKEKRAKYDNEWRTFYESSGIDEETLRQKVEEYRQQYEQALHERFEELQNEFNNLMSGYEEEYESKNELLGKWQGDLSDREVALKKKKKRNIILICIASVLAVLGGIYIADYKFNSSVKNITEKIEPQNISDLQGIYSLKKHRAGESGSSMIFAEISNVGDKSYKIEIKAESKAGDMTAYFRLNDDNSLQSDELGKGYTEQSRIKELTLVFTDKFGYTWEFTKAN